MNEKARAENEHELSETISEEIKKVNESNKDLIMLLKLLERLSEAERPRPTYTSHYVNMTAYSQ